MALPYVRVITPALPDDEPLTLDEVKLHLRIDTDDEDAWITPRITAARQAAEDFTNRFIAPQTLELRDGCWPAWQCGQALPGSDPATDVVVQYVAQDGTVTTLATDQYAVKWGAPSRLINAYDQHWPPARLEPDAIRITYKAGWGSADVPQTIKHAMLLTIGEWYENRENAVVGATVAELPSGVKALLWPSRISLGV